MTKDELKGHVVKAQAALSKAQAAFDKFNSLVENNVYVDMKDAESAIEDILYDRAEKDCEGSRNCGREQYTQNFMVDGKTYTGIASFEYDRHDKPITTLIAANSASKKWSPLNLIARVGQMEKLCMR